jgi:Flp pilus assembly pilin Flp
MKAKEWVKNSRLGRGLVRLMGEDKGAVAMEYIVIALLIGAAVVALVMVFGGNIRNMFAKTNDVMTSTKVSDVQSAGNAHRQEQADLFKKNADAVKAGDTLGGDFTEGRKQGTTSAKGGN